MLSGERTEGVTIRTCTWSTRHSPQEGCDNITDGMAAVDGIGVPEWSEFPLVLGAQSPLWGDIFVACEEHLPRGATLRLPDMPVKWDETVEVKLDAPATRWGERPGGELAEAVVAELSAELCAGTARVRGE